MIIIVLFCLCLATSNHKVDGRIARTSQDEDLDLEKQLKLINKPPLKTIQIDSGHIVDCIDINKQLAFDNPLLKKHKLQLKPSFQDTRTKLKNRERSAILSKIGIEKNLCPRGTVPIRRITKGDLIRAKRVSNIAGMLTEDLPGQHVAGVQLKENGDIYYGIGGSISTYNPKVEALVGDQMSGAYIWLANGPDDEPNMIFAGWQVNPTVYEYDHKTHFFTSWADNTRQTGCFDLLCAGFVQIDQSIYPGATVPNTSTYEGQQFAMTVSLSLDPVSKNWWLRLEGHDLGYFPATLFSNLTFANSGGWEGRTRTPAGNPSPPMGSGYFPDGNVHHACYIREMAFKTESGVFAQDLPVSTFADNPSCYDVKYYGFDEFMGCYMLFGGPGGDCGI